MRAPPWSRSGVRDALFVDVGSTTADLVPVVAGKVAALGYGDADRLVAGELVYTGMVRSFVMAMASRAPFRGVWTPLMNEFFASSADVHRILGALSDGADKMATADGRAKTVEASRARLARMIGREPDEGADAQWAALAAWFAEAQMREITDAAFLRLSVGDLDPAAPVVAAGIGESVAEEVARRLRRSCIGFSVVGGRRRGSLALRACRRSRPSVRGRSRPPASLSGRKAPEQPRVDERAISDSGRLRERQMRVAKFGMLLLAVGASAAWSGAAFGASSPSENTTNDYPTSTRAEYVFACMKANGETRKALDQCSCSIDVIASLIPYNSYVAGETVASLDQEPGRVGGMFRGATVAKEALANLRRAQAEAEIRCF